MHTVRYFGMVAERTGSDEEQIDLAQPLTVADLHRQLLQRHPSLQGLSFRIAVDHRLAPGDAAVPPGAEVALLPPFAGG